MPKLQVDTEKLAFGLEEGIDKGGYLLQGVDSLALDLSPQTRRNYTLRASVCGLASSAVWHHMRQQGIDARLYISKPRLSFDPSMDHVVAMDGDKKADDTTIVDGTYSQVLGYVGLTPEYELEAGTTCFPDEKIMVYRQADRLAAMEQLADMAVDFQAASRERMNRSGTALNYGRLAFAERQTIVEGFSRIWQPQCLMPWHPGEDHQAQIEELAAYIPAGTITA